jgi:hypothetical protein
LATRGVPRERRASSRAPRHRARSRARARADEDPLEIGRRVVLEPRGPAEAVAQRRGEQARARGRADEREARQVEPHRARADPLADQQIELEVLHRGIEDLLDRGREAVDLVDEQHVAASRFESSAARSPGRSIAGPLVVRSGAPSSFATAPASDVLPSPGGRGTGCGRASRRARARRG